jgi:two-component system NtrC family sensor kinase
VTLRITGEGPVPPVMVNAEVVQHVVLNLLVNAVQSCEDRGGSVALAFLVGPDVRIRIEDTGCGIPPESRRHLFEPFRSRKPRGTGLGLFLSRSFMRRFGGDICLVRSEVGAGSCFEIVFERVDRDEP